MPRLRLDKLVAILPALALSLLPTEARALDPACPWGVNAHQASNAALDLVESAGISWVRFDMNWLQFEPSKGNYDWTEADRFINHASSKGLSVFVTVAYTPMWAVGVPCNDADPNPVNWCHNALPANGADWTDFVTAAVARYGAQVKHWGMWNEPNLREFFKGSRPEYVSQILVPGSNAVHAACTDCKVLGPDLANLRGTNWDSNQGTCIGNSCIFNGWNYSLKEILKAAVGSLDVVTHHKYGDPASGWWSTILDGSYEVIKVTDGVKEVTDAHAPGKPVWITEVGWHAEPYGSVTNTYAATQLTTLYQGIAQVHAGTVPGAMNQPWPELERIFWYDLHDDPNGYSWGLLDASLVPKPQYGAYQQVITAAGSCAPDPSTTGAGGGAQGAGGGSGVGPTGAGGGAPSGAGPAGPTSGAGGNAINPENDAESGCACRSVERMRGSAHAWLALGLCAAAAWRRRTRA